MNNLKIYTSLSLILAGVGCGSAESETFQPQPIASSSAGLTAGAAELRVLSWNIHHGVGGVDHRLDLNRIAQLIIQQNVDIVSLQDVDRHFRPRSDCQDQFAELQRLLPGYFVAFSPSISWTGRDVCLQDLHQYGHMLLSRYPLLNVTKRNLPHSDSNEPITLLQALVPFNGRLLQINSTHLQHQYGTGEWEDAYDNERQAAAVASYLNPTKIDLLVGDLNAVPSESGMTKIWQAGMLDTASFNLAGANPSRLDYVLYEPSTPNEPGGVRTVGYQRVFSEASDHEAAIVAVLAVDNLVRSPTRSASNVASNADGRLEVLARGKDLQISRRAQLPGGGWSNWQPFSGASLSEPVVITNLDGRLEAFIRGIDNAVWHQWQVAPGGAWTATWTRLGGSVTSDIAAALNSDGRVELFARGTDGTVSHSVQLQPGVDRWTQWSSLGQAIVGRPEVTMDIDGRLALFVRGTTGTNDSVFHTWQVSPGSFGWAPWVSFGGSASDTPVAVMNVDGRLELFVRWRDTQVYHTTQTAPRRGWTGWSLLGGGRGSVLPGMTAIRNRDGRLELFARGTDNVGYHMFQIQAGGTWSNWQSIGGWLTSGPSIGMNADGRLEVFASGGGTANINMYHQWWDRPNPTAWSGWQPL